LSQFDREFCGPGAFPCTGVQIQGRKGYLFELRAQRTALQGTHPLRISIGELPISLHIPEEFLLGVASRRYREFAASGADALPVFFKQRTAEQRDDSRFPYELDGATVVLDSSSAEFRGVRHEYALDSLLRILLTVMLLPRRGFLLHAATVVRGGQAYVFMGRSGAGKSTVASLSPRGSVLTDEISLLRHTDGAWQAHGTPFWGEFRAAGMNCHFPIAGIYSLEQDSKDRVEPMPAKEMLRAILPCVLFFFARDKRANAALLHVLAGLSCLLSGCAAQSSEAGGGRNPMPPIAASITFCDDGVAGCPAASGFSVEKAHDIVIQVVWTNVPVGNHVQTLALSIPGGGLYQQTQTAFLIDGSAPGSVTFKRILPVTATWIEQRSITGPWTVEAVLDGQLVTSQALELNP
jgi:hypothetical protein